MADEEELDYMSDVFITELPDTKNRRRKRPSQTNKIIKTKKQLKHELESTVRTQGLATPISEDNKGFEMLHKMGYRPGGALGKSGTGRTDPLPLVVKGDRQGLGREEHVKESQEKQKEQEHQLLQTYQGHQRCLISQRQIKMDLYKSQRSCQHLDEINGFTEPLISWYWPNEEYEDEEEEVPDEEEQLSLLTEYLRSNYYYCLWCGTTYSDEDSILKICPGDTRQDHQL